MYRVTIGGPAVLPAADTEKTMLAPTPTALPATPNVSVDPTRAELERAITAAGRQWRTDPAAARATLSALFRQGTAPEPALDGRYRGALITLTLHPILNDLFNALTDRWLPWQGKTFTAAAQIGDNIFTNDALPLARLVFPFYRRDVPDAPGRSRALQFCTSLGPSGLDPAVTVLKIDYDLDLNPAFVVRRVLDELVQVTPGYYLGQALLRRGSRARPRWVCGAYFTLAASSAAA